MYGLQTRGIRIVYHRDREVTLRILAEQESLVSSIFVTKEGT